MKVTPQRFVELMFLRPRCYFAKYAVTQAGVHNYTFGQWEVSLFLSLSCPLSLSLPLFVFRALKSFSEFHNFFQ